MKPPTETDETVRFDGEAAAAGDGSVAAGSLGRYRLDGVLGQGGMGIVYRAHDPDLERRVALKVLRGAGDAAARARLLREARAMAQLSHPNVVTVFEVGSSGGRDFVAMELIDGSSVDQWLRQRRPLAEVLDVFVQAARGLAAAHAKGLVHRDFKPHNVLVSRDGKVIVTDFGLARAAGEAAAVVAPNASATGETATAGLTTASGLEETHASTPSQSAGKTPGSWSSTLTATGAMVGTPAYMAPEQWEGGSVDQRTDQFSYCIALWEAAAGERPFTGKDLDSLRIAVSAGPPPAGRDVPPWLDAILRRGLSPRAADRWPDIDAVIAAIARGRSSRGRRMRAGIIATVAAVVAIAAVVLAGVLSGGSQRAAPSSTPAPALPPAPPPAPASIDARILRHLEQLMPLPAAPGNAGEEYLALSRRPKIEVRFLKALKPDERAKLEALAADPVAMAGVELLRAGAVKRNCALMGVLVPWGAGLDPFTVEIPEVYAILSHAGLLRFIAADLAERGQLDEAKRRLEQVVWVGWHFQREPVLLYNMLGVAFSADASEQLAELETDTARAQRWRVLAGLFRGRKYDDYTDRRDDWDAVEKRDATGIDRIAAVVDSPDALPGARAESMRMIAIAHLLGSEDLQPTEQQRAHLARWTKLDDPRLRALAVRVQAIFDVDAGGRATLRKGYADLMP